MRESGVSGRKILAAAIALSLAVHLFWLCALRIVVSPGQSAHAKFSRVTFLGPILTAARTEVTAARRERSYLEDRHYRRLGRAAVGPRGSLEEPEERRECASDANAAAEAKYVVLVGSAVEKAKVEPEYAAE